MTSSSTASLVGRFLSTTGIVHTEKDCSTGGARRYRNDLITSADIEEYDACGMVLADFKICKRCS